ncbi:hypothetical protein SynA1825c_02722 [Synechococcus sp. A18-25c]|nr:hypothetical protein SynA1825c_02722 [Synechococcus sp. A18-25c]
MAVAVCVNAYRLDVTTAKISTLKPVVKGLILAGIRCQRTL